MKIRENKVIQPNSFAKLYSIVFLQVSVFIKAQNLTEKRHLKSVVNLPIIFSKCQIKLIFFCAYKK